MSKTFNINELVDDFKESKAEKEAELSTSQNNNRSQSKLETAGSKKEIRNAQICLVVTPSKKEAIKDKAFDSRMTVNEWLNQIIDKELKK